MKSPRLAKKTLATAICLISPRCPGPPTYVPSIPPLPPTPAPARAAWDNPKGDSLLMRDRGGSKQPSVASVLGVGFGILIVVAVGLVLALGILSGGVTLVGGAIAGLAAGAVGGWIDADCRSSSGALGGNRWLGLRP